MNKLYTLIAALFVSTTVFAQCDPMAYDFGGAAYGVYPDTSVGLADGVIGQPYNQVMYFMIPSDAGLVDPAYSGYALTSVELLSITYNNGLPISNLGLAIACNPANCIFPAGQQKCATLSGTPTQTGVFNIEINVLAAAVVIPNIFEPEVDYSFPGYSLTITDGNAVIERASSKFELSNAKPNPASSGFNLNFDTPVAENVQIAVHNMLGAQVFHQNFNAKRGHNTVWMDTQDWEEGVYLYSVQNGITRSTKRIVVQH